MSEATLINKQVTVQLNNAKEEHAKGNCISVSSSGIFLEEVGRKIIYSNFYPWCIVKKVVHEVKRHKGEKDKEEPAEQLAS